MAKVIPLTQGQVALVDDQDFERVNKHKWYADKHNHTYYARTHIPTTKGKVFMHRHILGLTRSDKIFTDHIDGNGLNNTRANIRKCNQHQNLFNKRYLKQKKLSQYTGVRLKNSKTNLWSAYINLNRKQYHLGMFKTEEQAAKAYDEAAKELFGEFAKLNFPQLEDPNKLAIP